MLYPLLRRWSFVLAVGFCVATPARAQISIILSGTSNNNALGYTIGQPVTFTYTLNGGFGNNATSYFDASYNNWYEFHLTADSLFSAITGTGLTGTYTRPTFDDTDPHSYLQLRKNVDGSGFDFMQMSAATQHGDMGLSVGGNLVSSVYLQLNRTGANFAFAGVWDEPTNVLGAALGTYDPSGGSIAGMTVSRVIGGSANFNITSLTISTSAIPEASTYAVWTGLGAIAWVVVGRRRWKRR